MCDLIGQYYIRLSPSQSAHSVGGRWLVASLMMSGNEYIKLCVHRRIRISSQQFLFIQSQDQLKSRLS